MQEMSCVAEKRNTVRDRINKLHALLTEALTIEGKICGDEPGEKAIAEPPDIILTTIESDLDRAISKASSVVSQLNRIAERL